MGILIVTLLHIGNANLAHDIHGDLFGLFLVLRNVEQSGLVDLVADGIHGREGNHGFLEDHGDLLATDGTDLIVLPLIGKADELHFTQLFRVEHDLAAGDTFLIIDAQNCLTGQGLTTAGFADQA